MASVERVDNEVRRLRGMGLLGVLFAVIVVFRLFTLQIWQHDLYTALAAGTHQAFQELFPARGGIFIKDGTTGKTVPVAIHRDVFTVFANTTEIPDPEKTARAIDDAIFIGDAKRWEIYQTMKNQPNDPYVPLIQRITEDEKNKLEEKNVTGINFVRRPYRYYPEGSVGAHVIGFFGLQEDGTPVGRYGIEGFYDKELAGLQGTVRGERDALGAWIPFGRRDYAPAKDGVDITLTIDRAIQYEVCTDIERRAKEFSATGAAAIVMDPKTGAIMALCSYPVFDPNEYQKIETIQQFNNNAIFHAYEPGSIMKPLIMAAALDQEVVTPDTEFEDPGVREIEGFKIKNAGEKKYGKRTMREVLVNSINTGMVFVAERLGRTAVREYIESFGFGTKTGIQLDTEVAGTIAGLKKDGAIYAATASFGQGITATALQMVQAYSALANGGKMVKPYLVEKIQDGDDTRYEAEPAQYTEVLSPRAAALTADMMVSVMEEGHAKTARVVGYRLAGKTGTAEIAEGAGYGEDTIHSFVGFGPIEDPQFVMITVFERPKIAGYAESTAAPVFGELAKFILQYKGV
ncbi:MAG: penicillin-binding protein 2, partial [Patescibacteria group bacterium]